VVTEPLDVDVDRQPVGVAGVDRVEEIGHPVDELGFLIEEGDGRLGVENVKNYWCIGS